MSNVVQIIPDGLSSVDYQLSTVWDINETRYTVNRISRFYGPGAGILAKMTEFITDPGVKELTIASRYFANNKLLESVDLQSVENLTIEEGAFEGCEKLVEFILAKNPTKVSIKENAFAGCSLP